MTFQPNWAAAPGDSIVRIMSKKEIQREELVEELGLSEEEFLQLVSGRARISKSVAAKLSDCLGSTTEFWLRRDEIHASEVCRLQCSSDDDLLHWSKSFPVSQMSKFGWIEKNLRSTRLQNSLLDFFGCESLSEWKAFYVSGLDEVAFRASSAFKADDMATLVWKRMGEKQAAERILPEFDKAGFEQILPDLKKLGFIRSPQELIERLRLRLEEVGVALTTARAPSGCRASGATWMLDSGNPIIHLSFRYLSDDHFWFTLYHEAAHIILGHGEHVSYEDRKVVEIIDRHEREANQLASSLLVSLEIRSWLSIRKPSKDAVLTAARKAKVSPGVIVGQLEKAAIIVPGKLAYLKRRFAWGEGSLVPVQK